MHTIDLVLAEDHHVVRAAIAALLQNEPDIDVIGEVADASMLIDVVEALNPKVLVLDAHIPGHRVIETTRLLRRRCPAVQVLVLSAYDRREYVVGLLGAGAAGYVLKDDPAEALIQAVRVVAQGGRWISPRVTHVLAQAVGGDDLQSSDQLTERENDVLQLMAAGARNDEIAEMLSITGQTVKNYVRSIFRKLGVETRVEAVLYAIDQGLVRQAIDEPL